MSKLTKNQKLASEKIEAGKTYSLKEAAQLVKDVTFTKFDASVDIDVRLGVDPRKANQMVRGVVSLPHGTGKQVRVLALCTPDQEADAKAAGADYVGLDEYIEKIKGGWTDIDVIITQPSVMGKIGALGRVLGPRGLMPNPKSGTVTNEVGKAVKEVKQGKIDFKVDKNGIVHTSIGKISFSADQIRENAKEFIEAGASHVIVTSYVFKDGKVNYNNLEKILAAVGKEHLVLDLSCRKKDGDYYIVTDRWQKFTEEKITPELLDKLKEYADEFLVHAVDVEGKASGIEVPLAEMLGDWGRIPITYAGGVGSFEDLKQLKEHGKGRLNVTIGSALDLFGGRMAYKEVLQYINQV